MVFNREENIKKTIYVSLFLQIIISLYTSRGLFIHLNQEDSILKEILKIELLVQVIESSFYIWVILALKDYDNLTRRRYIDWIITTPMMLLSTIIFMKYLELKENNEKNISFYESIQEEKENIKKIFVYNSLMLLFGYLGESNRINKNISIFIGFIFFSLTFKIVYQYAKKTKQGMNLYIFLVIVWSFYGFAAMLGDINKNISYNILDIFSKNFYGLYIYYIIATLKEKKKEICPDL